MITTTIFSTGTPITIKHKDTFEKFKAEITCFDDMTKSEKLIFGDGITADLAKGDENQGNTVYIRI